MRYQDTLLADPHFCLLKGSPGLGPFSDLCPLVNFSLESTAWCECRNLLSLNEILWHWMAQVMVLQQDRLLWSVLYAMRDP